ncbi:NADH-quinone oxidoreductase, subunit G [Nitrospira sp. KM1]|uniref:NADH-quinone oxidoreductase subunit NuoG n=1 Tax=Nitrospira sp. KM1 TaxID=1936990 RepID=UPI0013A79BD8|nr:NADH-quinone oxidoreductase subunit NuoG [Nitrospira sp. KM1]BCA55751.1 NADH-quinone oxidoreductase, subunit G [Nitrospira sp. KM1]
MAETTTDTVRLTIDGISVTVPKGTLVIEAARRVGVMIPHFCYHPKLKPDANCRMCLVEIEKMPKLQTSCSTVASDGMAVRTATSVVNDAHKSVLEFILANHPLDCPVCDQGGRCDLQDFSHEYTATAGRFAETKRIFQKEYFSPLIETQMNRCVQCLRCVRYCDEVMDVKALAPSGRGTMTEIKSFSTHPLDCEFCGGCVQICPVGAITSRLSMYEYRPWMLKRADTICQYCGDGCQITVQTKGQLLVEVNSAHGAGRNNGDLCPRGFFGYHAATHPDRITKPLIRRNGTLVESTWEEALQFAADEIGRLKAAHGSQAFGGLISGRCTNEDLYLFQKFMRLVVGTNNLDSSARYGQINGVQAMRRVQGTHRWTVSLEDLSHADTLLLIGTNITETNPIAGLRVKEAVKKHGATLCTIDSMVPAVGTISNIANLSHHHVCVQPPQLGSAVLGLIKAVIDHNGVDPTVRSQAAGYVEALTQAAGALSWTDISSVTGASQEQFMAIAQQVLKGRRVVVLAGQELLRSSGGYSSCVNLLDLLLLLGKLTSPGCGLATLAEENNDQGAAEMGALAELLPGPRDCSDSESRNRIGQAWKAAIPAERGATLVEMIEQATRGSLKAMIIVGENPLGSLPAQLGAAQAIGQLEFLLCQELFLTETALQAHVVLPASSSMEKAGTFTNQEGHAQSVRPAIEPVGDSRPDWEILSVLSVLLGTPLEYAEAKDVLKEIRSIIPGYGSLGPAPVPPKADQSTIARYLTEGYRLDLDRRYTLAPRTGQAEGTVDLGIVQSLFHSGKLSTRAKGLLQVESSGSLRMSAADADACMLKNGDRVRLSNGRGSFTTTVKLTDRVPRGTVWFPDHFAQQAMDLFECTIDAVTRVPSFRNTSVSIVKIP